MLFSVTMELCKGSVAFVNTGSANSSLDEKVAVDHMWSWGVVSHRAFTGTLLS